MIHASPSSLRTRLGASIHASLLALLALLALFALTPSIAAAEEDPNAPVEYEVIEDPQPAEQPPPPPPPAQYGQPQTTVYAQPAQPQGVTTGPVVTTQAAPQPAVAPARGAYRTGITGGLFLSYSPEGRLADYDSSGYFTTADFPATLGFGGHFGGLGRHFGGGLQARVVWVYDLALDSTWSITDVHGMMRGRGRWGIFEFYGEVAGGFSVQRVTLDDGVYYYSDSSGGLSFGASLGFRIFATDTLSFFLEPGMMWRMFFTDVAAGDSSAFGMRQFTLELGIAFGA